MNFINLNKPLWQWAVILLLAFIWGSSFILMKRGLEVFSPVQVASLRMIIAGIILMPFALKNIRYLKNNYKALLIVGFIGNGIPAYLFTWSQMHVSSSAAGILNSLTPVFTLIAGFLFFRTRIVKLQIIGVVLGLAGSVLLFLNKSFSFQFSIFTWGLLIIAATAMYGININHVKYNLKELHGFTIAALSFMLILPFAVFMYFMNLPCICIAENEAFTTSLWSVIILGVFGSAFAVAIINILIKYTSAVFASTVTYIMPAVALIWGYSDNETITFSSGLALILILSGVYLIQHKTKTNEK